MNKWYILVALLIFPILILLKKQDRFKKSTIIRKLDSLINWIFWILLLAYGAAFVYWLLRVLG